MLEHALDFRVGGTEISRFRFGDGPGAYFDDPDAVKNREEGSRGLLDALAAELDRAN